MIKLIITENQANQRLDRFLKKYYAKAPLSMIYRMIRKDVKLNGKRAKVCQAHGKRPSGEGQEAVQNRLRG